MAVKPENPCAPGEATVIPVDLRATERELFLFGVLERKSPWEISHVDIQVQSVVRASRALCALEDPRGGPVATVERLAHSN